MSALMLRRDNPMNRPLAVLLVFDVVVFGLALPGMLIVSDVSVAKASVATGLAAVLCLVAAATLRHPIGWVLGWLAQIAGIALGALTSMMYIVGGIFALIWVVSFLMGRHIEQVGSLKP